MKSHCVLTALFFLVMLCGCGASVPSEGDAKKAVQEYIVKSYENGLTLVSFHKTNGQLEEMGGVKHYSMNCEGEVEGTKNGAGSRRSFRRVCARNSQGN